MKHLKLFDKKDSLAQDIITNPSADYPIIALCENEDELSFWNTPIIKAKFNITSDDDVKSCILSDYNIKSLTIDGELKFKKDTWVKYEYQLTQGDFLDLDNNKLDRIVRPEIYVKLNSGCRNVYLKSDEKATQFLLLYPTNNGNYDFNYIDTNFINIEETKESLFIKQIDEYTYDLTNFYLYYDKTINNKEKNLVGIFLADNEGNVLTQNLEFECFDVNVRHDPKIHQVTKENALNTDINFGPKVSISGEIDINDYIFLGYTQNGQLLGGEPIPIQEIIGMGAGRLSNNTFDLDLGSVDLGEVGLIYALIDKSFNGEGSIEFIKDCTITYYETFTYLPILSVGEHDIEVELLQLLYTPFFYTNALIDLDMSHVNGEYIHINNICDRANQLKQVCLPNGLNSIGNYAFYGCTSLTSVTIPDSVTSIGSDAFRNCTSLSSITCHATTAPTLGDYALSYLSTNGKLYVPSGSDYSSWLSSLPSGWAIEYI